MIDWKRKKAEWFTSLLEQGEITHGNEVSHQLSKLLVEHAYSAHLFIIIFKAYSQYKSAKYFKYLL